MLDVGQRLATRDRDAVPLREPVRLDVVARVFELLERELLGLALDLLHRQHVDALAHREVDDPVDAGADGVDVPGGKTHGIKPTATRRRGAVHRSDDRVHPQGGSGAGCSAEVRAQLSMRDTKTSTRRRVRSGSPSGSGATASPGRRARCRPRSGPTRAACDRATASRSARRARRRRRLRPRSARGARHPSAGASSEERRCRPAEEREVVDRMHRARPDPSRSRRRSGRPATIQLYAPVSLWQTICARCERSPARLPPRARTGVAGRGRRRGTGAARRAASGDHLVGRLLGVDRRRVRPGEERQHLATLVVEPEDRRHAVESRQPSRRTRADRARRASTARSAGAPTGPSTGSSTYHDAPRSARQVRPCVEAYRRRPRRVRHP